ncbi:MAG: hypothetical protein ACXVBW_06845, partial [Bdellovibrionota bacterium]
ATPLGTIPGFSFGLEVTMVHMTDSFIALLGGNPPLSFLPSVRFHFAKGIGPVDLSTSAFYLPGILMLGGAVKWTFWNKEEGPSWAARVSYAYSYFPFPPTLPGGQPLMSAPFNINFITHTITPVVMMSRKLNMGVEPYIGAGMQIAFGGFDVSIPIDPSISALLPNHQTKIEDFIPGLGLAGIGFIGLSSHIPYLGLGITIEMQYNTAGASSIGFDLGFTF